MRPSDPATADSFRPRSCGRFSLAASLTFVAAGLAALAVAAATGTPSRAGPSAADDPGPRVEEIVELLEEGLSSSLIVEWLDSRAAPPATLTSEDLLRLKRAGASEELIHRLLAGADGGRERPEAPAAGQDESVRGSAGQQAGASCRLALAIDYRAVEPMEGELPGPGRDLFVYLDGRLVARVASRGDLLSRDVQPVELSVAPGAHTLRLARERHVKRRDGSWRHESRVCPERVRFRVEPGSDWKLELAWTESVFGGGDGELDWALARDGRPAGAQRGIEAPKERWPSLCEDIEASAGAAAGKSSRAPGRALARCVRWSSLWDEGDGVPSRAQALSQITRQAR